MSLVDTPVIMAVYVAAYIGIHIEVGGNSADLRRCTPDDADEGLQP